MARSIGADRAQLINQRFTDEDSSGRIESVDSSLVGESESTDIDSDAEAEADAATATANGIRLPGDRAPASPTMTSVARAGAGAELSVPSRSRQASFVHRGGAERQPSDDSLAGKRTSPVLIVRTYSVRHGRKASYHVQSTTSLSGSPDDSDSPPGKPNSPGTGKGMGTGMAEQWVANRKSLRLQVAHLVGAYPEVCVDLSYNWRVLDQTPGARTALATGLLAGGGDKKLSIDLSNRRVLDLREGANVRYQQGLSPKDWSKSITDGEASGLTAALCREIGRVAREQVEMPQFSVVCHDQPLATVVYPLVKVLAVEAGVLHGLYKLDLNRYSRSAEVGQARPGSADAAAGMERFVIQLGTLLATTRSLRELCLRMNGLTAIDLATLMVAANATLVRLDLSRNPLSAINDFGVLSQKGIRALARHLRKNVTLVELDLSYCEINNEGANLLVKGLTNNRQLAKLVLAGNPIRADHPIFSDARVVAGPGAALHQ